MSSRLRIAILISGRGSNMKALVTACSELDAEIVLVGADRPCEGLNWAKTHNIPTILADRNQIKSKHLREHSLATSLEHYAADWIFLAGYMAILSSEFIERFHGRIINIHPSLLPEFKGLNTHQRALDAGVKQHGASVHLVTPGLDEGPVILQAALDITASDAHKLAEDVLRIEHLIYPCVLRALAQKTLQINDHNIIWSDDAEFPQTGQAGITMMSC